MTYVPVAVLPNLALHSAIDTQFASLAPISDSRIAAMVTQNSHFGDFISRFQNAFGRKVEPAVIMIRNDAPETYLQAEAIAGFRDAIAFSAVGYGKAMQINSGSGWALLWSNYFSIYPWMIAKNGNRVVAFTSAIAGMDLLDKFHGQSSPELFTNSYGDNFFDRTLRDKLLARWHQAFSTASPERFDVVLFRSLNMALAASAIPSGQEITYYDVGRHIALWISAFEILSHPGVGGGVNLMTVYSLLESAPWKDAASREQTHPAYNRGAPAINKINACWLYGELYRQRNKFLHGNAVTADDLRLPSGQRLIDFAAPLFRMALAAYLQLELGGEVPSDSDTAKYTEYLAKHISFYGYQHTIEDALLTAHAAPEIE